MRHSKMQKLEIRSLYFDSSWWPWTLCLARSCLEHSNSSWQLYSFAFGVCRLLHSESNDSMPGKWQCPMHFVDPTFSLRNLQLDFRRRVCVRSWYGYRNSNFAKCFWFQWLWFFNSSNKSKRRKKLLFVLYSENQSFEKKKRVEKVFWFIFYPHNFLLSVKLEIELFKSANPM